MLYKKIKLNTKHLMKGDPLPPYNGKLRLYTTRMCPFAYRVILVLAAKNIDCEIVNIDLIDKPEWLVLKNSSEKVPALEVADGVIINESLIISEYLDDAYLEKRLISKDPLKKAFDKIIVEALSPIIDLIIKLIKVPKSCTDEVVAEYFKALDFIQDQLHKRGTTFLAGEEPGYADYMSWPWFERRESYTDERIKLDSQKYKRLIEYIGMMHKTPIVEEYAVPIEIYREFDGTFAAGKKPNYDLLLEE